MPQSWSKPQAPGPGKYRKGRGQPCFPFLPKCLPQKATFPSIQEGSLPACAFEASPRAFGASCSQPRVLGGVLRSSEHPLPAPTARTGTPAAANPVPVFSFADVGLGASSQAGPALSPCNFPVISKPCPWAGSHAFTAPGESRGGAGGGAVPVTWHREPPRLPACAASRAARNMLLGLQHSPKALTYLSSLLCGATQMRKR